MRAQPAKKKLSRKVSTAPFLVMFVAVVVWMWLASPGRASAGPAMSAPQAAEGGDVLFLKRCGGCHSVDQDKEGPRLHHVYGAKAGSVASFKYSSALKASNVVWNDATLDKWLTSTDSVVPDNDMDYRVSKPEERAAIIQYLKSISSK
jgi:cytochrome c